MLTSLVAISSLAFVGTVDNIQLRPVAFRAGEEVQIQEFRVSSSLAWDEAVVSWNIRNGENAALKIEAIVLREESASKPYLLAEWTLDPTFAPRQSLKDQGDDVADVYTDTLSLKNPGGDLLLRVSTRSKPEGPLPKWKGLWVSLSAPTGQRSGAKPNKKAWGKTIEAPQRAQMNYPNGSVICSPTAVSMSLAHWAKALEDPAIDQDVPDVVAGVYDPVWKGTGNWPFNTAFAGSRNGLQAWTARLPELRTVEDLIVAGVPVITSVSYAMLKGKPAAESGDGHLVMVVGFDEQGDPVFNDPGRNQVRQKYKREDFQRAWAHSRRTAYLIYPEKKRIPVKVRRA